MVSVLSIRISDDEACRVEPQNFVSLNTQNQFDLTSLILKMKPFSKCSYVFESATAYISTFTLNVESRGCLLGEKTLEFECVFCPENYYVLNISEECYPCVENAVCYGGAQIYPKDGYFWMNGSSDKMYKCYLDTCVQNDTCVEGYQGVLC